MDRPAADERLPDMATAPLELWPVPGRGIGGRALASFIPFLTYRTSISAQLLRLVGSKALGR